MLNIVIPLAGEGSRFQRAGYSLPKPLIPVGGRPLIELLIERLRPAAPHRFLFAALRRHAREFGIDRLLRRWCPRAEIILLDAPTAGPAASATALRTTIDDERPLLVAHCGPYVDFRIEEFVDQFAQEDADAFALTATSECGRWPTLRFGPDGRPCEFGLRRTTSTEATCGIYAFRHGSDFVRATDAAGRTSRGAEELSIEAALNALIASGGRVGLYYVGPENAAVHAIDTPDDLVAFADRISERMTRGLMPRGDYKIA